MMSYRYITATGGDLPRSLQVEPSHRGDDSAVYILVAGQEFSIDFLLTAEEAVDLANAVLEANSFTLYGQTDKT